MLFYPKLPFLAYLIEMSNQIVQRLKIMKLSELQFF